MLIVSTDTGFKHMDWLFLVIPDIRLFVYLENVLQSPSWNCTYDFKACMFVPRTTSLKPLQSCQSSWFLFGSLNHIVFIWKYFSCISAMKIKEEMVKKKKKNHTPCCVNPGEGLEPCHSSLSLHQLSLIAREDRIPRAQLFFILFGASEAWKAKGLLLIFLCYFFFLSSPTILSLRVRHSVHTVPLLHPR